MPRGRVIDRDIVEICDTLIVRKSYDEFSGHRYRFSL